MKYFALSIFITIMLSCEHDCNKEKELIHGVFRIVLETNSTFEYVSTVVSETEPLLLDSNSIFAPPGNTWISQKDFDNWVAMNVINSDEADFMFSSIGSSKKFIIDPTLIRKSILWEEEYVELFTKHRKDAFDIIQAKYGTSCFVKFGTPLFNKDSTKVLLTINKYCGYLNGIGLIFILEKINDSWQVIYKKEAWVS